MKNCYPKNMKKLAFVCVFGAGLSNIPVVHSAPVHEISGNAVFSAPQEKQKTEPQKRQPKNTSQAKKLRHKTGKSGAVKSSRKYSRHSGAMTGAEIPGAPGQSSYSNVNAYNPRVMIVSYRPAAEIIYRPYEAEIHQAALRYNIPEDLIHAIVHTESNYNHLMRGGAGEVGLMQIRPSTARLLGYQGAVRELYNPDINLEYGVRYLALARYLSDGSLCGTVLKYNAGLGAKRMNPISARYCRNVENYLYNAGWRI